MYFAIPMNINANILNEFVSNNYRICAFDEKNKYIYFQLIANLHRVKAKYFKYVKIN